MGYWAGRENRKFFIENGVVLSGPKGVPISVDPVTLEFVDTPPPAPPIVAEVPKVDAKEVLSDFTDEKKVSEFVEGKNVKPLQHSDDCDTKGRGGRYSPGCPKCAFLKKGK